MASLALYDITVTSKFTSKVCLECKVAGLINLLVNFMKSNENYVFIAKNVISDKIFFIINNFFMAKFFYQRIFFFGEKGIF